LLGGHDWQHNERAYFGEESAPVGAPPPPREPPASRRGTVEQLRQWRIERGECPRASCTGSLDSEDACPVCGWSLVEEEMRDRLARKERPEDRDDWLETLPGALMLEVEERSDAA
jgi:hypothetical protein